MTRYAMVMDTRRCIGCHSCTVACRTWNELPIDLIYNPVLLDGPVGRYPNVHMNYMPLICMHCDEPACVGACPTGASQQDPDGIVWIEDAKCIGCKACVQACPYNARHMNHETHVVAKCNFCKDRVHEGKEPHCVKTCHQRARIFGDLDDPNSDVSKLVNSVNTVRLLEELETDPQVYYILGTGGQG